MGLFGWFGHKEPDLDVRPKSVAFTLRNAGLVYEDGRVGLKPTDLVISERRVAVIGLNGAGKSTLLQVLDGSHVVTEGSMTVTEAILEQADGAVAETRTLDPAVKSGSKQLKDIIGIVRREEIPESYYQAENISEAVAAPLKKRRIPEGVRHETVGALFAHFGLTAYARHQAASLDSEKRHLLAIVGALATAPAVIVADEPTKGLDERSTATVAKALFGYDKQVIFATHDLSLISNPAYRIDRVLVMDEQIVAFDGGPKEALAFYDALIRRKVAQSAS